MRRESLVAFNSNLKQGHAPRDISRLKGFQNGGSGTAHPPNYHLGQLLTIPELAAALKVSPRTVRSWIERRQIEFTKLGRRVYFTQGIVENILNRNAIPALQPTRPRSAQGGAEQTEGGSA